MIIVNQERNLFLSIRDVKIIEVYREEKDIEVRVDNKGYQYAVCIYGQWIFKVNGKVVARYDTESEKNQACEDLIKASEHKKDLFVFPEKYKISKVSFR